MFQAEYSWVEILFTSGNLCKRLCGEDVVVINVCNETLHQFSEEIWLVLAPSTAVGPVIVELAVEV